MKRFFSLLISALMLFGTLASCGEQPNEQPTTSELPGTSSEEPGTDPATEPKTEPETEPVSTEEPATSKYETEYVAPEDGSFTICGIPLSEYTEVVYLPARDELSFVNPADYKNKFLEITESAIGMELEIKIAKNEKMFTEKRYEHEILFGTGFVRDGIPEPDLSKTYYGVTADGTIYFCSPSVSVYSYLWELFLEEFCGVPLKSGQRSGGCSVSECYRELPNFTAESAQALGYSQVFSDEFDGTELDLSVWKIKHEGDMGGYFETASQDFLRDGDLILRGEWLEDGPYGEGWYTGDIGLIQGYARGYFESRIQCSKCNGRSVDFWSAFWIQGPSPYNAETSQGGIGPGGAEIDIMENFGPDHHTSCVYCGWGEGWGGLLMDFVAVPNLGNRYDEEYHIYGLLWDENYYQVYLDGVLVHCSDLKAGTSSVEEEVRFSLCARQGGLPDRIKGEPREMKVDYLRIWQRSTEE